MFCNAMNEKQFIGKVTFRVKVRRAMWNVVSALLFRPFGTKVFRLWRLSLLRLFGARVSWHCDVYASAQVWAPWNLVMKSGSCLGPHVICYNQACVMLDEQACVSQYATLCTAGHDVAREKLKAESEQSNSLSAKNADIPANNAQTGLVVAPITLRRQAWVGMQAFVGMGVEVGEKSVVGARANVFKDVPAQSVVYAAVGNCTSL